jgi:hypothetical protein
MATLTKKQIADFVAANLGDPQAIASAAAQYGVSASDIADAMGTDVATVNNYFSNAGITLSATPAANTATTPTPTSVTLSPTDSGLVKGNMTYSGGDYQVGVFQQVAAPILTAIQNGTAKVTEDANGVSVTDTATGQVYNKANTGVELDITPSGQLSMTTQVGKAQQGQVVAPISPNGMVTSVDTSTVQQVGYPGSSGGLLGSIFDSLGNINAKTVVEAGLAYALPVAGQAIAASLGTSASIGTAIAATAAGVAQGQDPLTAAKNALPSLVASNLITTSGAQDFLDSVSNNATTQQAITNAATSAAKTAAAGGTASDIFNNMASTVAGTELGSATGSTALGQGIASTLASGNVSSGIVSSAGVLGSQEAATTEKLSKMIPTTDSSGNQLFFDPTSGKTYNPDGTLNAPSNVPVGSIGTQIADTGVNVGGVGQIVYAENAAALGFDTSKLPVGYSLADQATADAYLKQFGVPLQNTQLPDGTYVSIAPTDFVQSVSPSAVTTTEQLTNVGIDVSTVPSKTNVSSNVAAITPTGAVADVTSNASGNVTAIPSNVTSNLGNVTITGQSPSNLGNVTIVGSKPSNLGNVTIVGQKPIDLGNVDVIGQKPIDLGNVTVTGTKYNLGNVTITSTPDNNVSSNVTDNNASNVVVSTSYVKPKTTSVLPSLVGQFSSPLTASPSAFTPAGSIPGQETGKEREDVWNVESLREGLGI